MNVNRSMGFALIALAGLFSGLAMAEAIVVQGNNSKPPKIYVKDGEPRGILVEMLQYIDQQVGFDLSIRLLPWNRAYQNARDGKAGIVGLSLTQERREVFDYSDEMFVDELLLVVKKGNEFDYRQLSDLQGKVVGVQRGSSYGDKFERGRSQIFKVDTDRQASSRLFKLLNGRIDVALIGPGRAGLDRVIGTHPGLVENRDQFVVLPTPFKRDPNYLGFAKSLGKTAELDEINRAIRTGWSSGVFQEIIDRNLE